MTDFLALFPVFLLDKARGNPFREIDSRGGHMKFYRMQDGERKCHAILRGTAPSFLPPYPPNLSLSLFLLSSFSGRQAGRLLGPPSQTQQTQQPTYGNDIRGGESRRRRTRIKDDTDGPNGKPLSLSLPPLLRVCGVGIMGRRMKEAGCSLHLPTCSTKSLWRRHRRSPPPLYHALHLLPQFFRER
ncbi:hypothetical protein BDP81DRAFT_4506 [Colletotrichum phormii]|uniref:Uncharacterized protein n=1 Tax=Colletotrichum phormii TaxID=359342 RepID=A0AAJ0A2Y8_9PEZI|nr:uncharacterized protein BDP81DRAFT_4506 [Colletotrichum phormii]KAK1655476.1 hypothetical protein BDP81DRAFT_4506 [Colletotrichum phormii]